MVSPGPITGMLKRIGVTHQDIADQIGCSRQSVSRRIKTGRMTMNDLSAINQILFGRKSSVGVWLYFVGNEEDLSER